MPRLRDAARHPGGHDRGPVRAHPPRLPAGLRPAGSTWTGVCRALGPRLRRCWSARHYFYRHAAALRELHAAGPVIDVSRPPGVEDLCLAADALVTDYSSIMFDYAILDRPIVVHADDWDAYRAARGIYFDLLSGRPAPGRRSPAPRTS